MAESVMYSPPASVFPVVTITIRRTVDGRYVVSDDGGHCLSVVCLDDHGGTAKEHAEYEAQRRMQFYTGLGHPVLPWAVP